MTPKAGYFECLKQSRKSNARAGILYTAHGPIETPVFMPVGTQASVKSVNPESVRACGAEIILSNTYHLSLRPGVEIIQEAGGLHTFMNWHGPILTDSGGYQVFSLQGQRKINQNGVTFRSHLDGAKHEFTPQRVIDLQLGFGSDIMMPLDICTPYPSAKEQVQHDLKQTFLWEQEARSYWGKKNEPNSLFGLVQGGVYKDLRQESAESLISLDFPGYAIGGLSVGEPLDKLHDITRYTAKLLPKNKPRYLMGVGLPENMAPCIASGIDMFDCVAPTRLARHGNFFTDSGRGNIRNKCHSRDFTPLVSGCACDTCRHFSKAYIRHLFIAKELLAMTLLSQHNLFHLIHRVKAIRNAILSDDF